MQNFMAERREMNRNFVLPFFEMRVGIHTGQVVAGIVGLKKFQSDIWGDMVNTASGMETYGEGGKVNISKECYLIIQKEPGLSFDAREITTVTGKGE
jgi:adenylate cyclase